MGRIPTLEGFLDTHLGSVETLPKIAEKYKDNPRVAIAVIDNSRGVEYATVSNLGFVERMARKYTREELKTKLIEALESAYEKSKKDGKDGFSESLYQAFKRHAP